MTCPANLGEPLTPRQTELMRYLCEGLTSAEISVRMQINRPTVTEHKMAARVKLGARTDAQAAVLFSQNKGNVR